MTYTEAIDSLFVMLENACNEIDYMVLVEGANEEGTAESKSKLEKAKELAKRVWSKICEAVIKLCSTIVGFIRKHITDPLMLKTKIKLKTQMPDVSVGFVNLVTKGSTLTSNISAALGGTLRADTIKKSLDLVEQMSQTISVQSGELNFTYGDAIKEIERMEGALAKIQRNNSIATTPDEQVRSDAIKLLNAFQVYISQLRGDLMNACDFSSSSRTAGFKNDKAQKAGARYSEEKASERHSADVASGRMHPKAESVGLTGNAAYTYASLLIEAANALKASGVIYEDANSTIDLTKQKDIEDIPEEAPVVNKEYPENTSGGPGKRDDCLDDIKDLVNGDSKAIDLLTKNDRSKTITESVDDIDLVFDL